MGIGVKKPAPARTITISSTEGATPERKKSATSAASTATITRFGSRRSHNAPKTWLPRVSAAYCTETMSPSHTTDAPCASTKYGMSGKIEPRPM